MVSVALLVKRRSSVTETSSRRARRRCRSLDSVLAPRALVHTGDAPEGVPDVPLPPPMVTSSPPFAALPTPGRTTSSSDGDPASRDIMAA
jgi:hypothetical protein